MPKKPAIITDPLRDLAAGINDAHRQCAEAATSAMLHARRAGGLLAEAKATLPHGQWLPWLAANFSFTAKTAQNYMRVAREWPALEAKAKHVSDLTFREASKLLSAPDEPTPPPTTPGRPPTADPAARCQGEAPASEPPGRGREASGVMLGRKIRPGYFGDRYPDRATWALCLAPNVTGDELTRMEAEAESDEECRQRLTSARSLRERARQLREELEWVEVEARQQQDAAEQRRVEVVVAAHGPVRPHAHIRCVVVADDEGLGQVEACGTEEERGRVLSILVAGGKATVVARAIDGDIRHMRYWLAS